MPQTVHHPNYIYLQTLFHVHVEHYFTSGVISVGDYLTFERGLQVLHTQSDGKSQEDRLEGLLMAMADFHVQINLLKVIYRILFRVIILCIIMKQCFLSRPYLLLNPTRTTTLFVRNIVFMGLFLSYCM